MKVLHDDKTSSIHSAPSALSMVTSLGQAVRDYDIGARSASEEHQTFMSAAKQLKFDHLKRVTIHH
eukprot:scaffold5821_cov36-Prasinocladus_malaysianus.AAC.2